MTTPRRRRKREREKENDGAFLEMSAPHHRNITVDWAMKMLFARVMALIGHLITKDEIICVSGTEVKETHHQ